MKFFLLLFVFSVFSTLSEAKLLRFEGCASHMSYISKKLMRSVETNGFVANMQFDSETGVGAGTVTLGFTDDSGAEFELSDIPLICRKLDKTRPTIVVAGMVICETSISVVGGETFFVTYEAYSGSTLSTLHGVANGKLIDVATNTDLTPFSCP